MGFFKCFRPSFAKSAWLFSYLYGMLSILIPTYNHCPSALVAALSAQGEALAADGTEDFAFEIIVADDGSTDRSVAEELRQLDTIAGCRTLLLPANVGRAAIRNRLAREARGGFLLFIDADAGVEDCGFVRKMWADRLRADVVCGRVGLAPRPGRPGHELRYAYEQAAERQRPACRRMADPYARLSSFCLMMRRGGWETVGFDERCTEYGYEDVLLGLALEAHDFSILHTDHTLVHLGLDTNAGFLRKTEAAARTLAGLGGTARRVAAAARIYDRLQRLHLAWTLGVLPPLLPLLRRQLMSRHPWLPLFHLYKLGNYVRALGEPGARTQSAD